MARNAQSLDCSASSSRSARSPGRRVAIREQPQLGARALPGEIRDRRRAPRAQVAALPPARDARSVAPARPRVWRLERVVERGQREALARGLLEHRSSHATPSYHQWPSSSVSSAHTHTPPSATRALHARDEVARVLGRQRARRAGGRRRRRRCSTRGGRAGAAVVVAVRRARRVAAARSTRAPSSPGRSATAPGRRRSRAASGGAGRRARDTWSARRTYARTPASSSSESSHGACAHSGSQKPPPHSPNRRRCESMPVCTWSAIPASVASSGSTAWVAADVQLACSSERAAADRRLSARSRSAAAAYSASERRAPRPAPASPGVPLDVARVRLRPDLLQERDAALDRPRRLELVAQHGRQRERDRRRAEHVSSSGR